MLNSIITKGVNISDVTIIYHVLKTHQKEPGDYFDGIKLNFIITNKVDISGVSIISDGINKQQKQPGKHFDSSIFLW